MESLKYVIDYGIIGILIFMSVISFALFLERRSTFKKIKLEKFRHKKELEMELTKGLYVIATPWDQMLLMWGFLERCLELCLLFIR